MLKTRLISLLALFAASVTGHCTIKYVNAAATGTNTGTSWTNAFTSLQSGIAATIPGDTIWVANGVYKPTTTTSRTIPFDIPSSVALFGGFAGTETSLSQRNYTTFQTVLSGDIGVVGTTSDNSYNVVKMTSASALTRLDGFKVVSGNANNPSFSTTGGGLRNSGGSPVIANCLFSDNQASDGAAVLHTSSGNITFNNCTFQYNTASGSGGAAYISTGTANFINCRLEQNLAGNGGALYLSGGVTSMDRCSVSGNTANTYAGGIYVSTSGSVKMYNSLLVGNTAPSECAISMEPLSNTLTQQFVNCTFAHNKCTGSSSGNYAIVVNTYTTFVNNIVWGNAVTGTNSAQMLPNGTVDNNIIQNNTITGTTNTYSFDPQFVAPGLAAAAPFVASAYNYRLSPISQAIDTGTSTYLSPIYTLDLDGTARTFGPRPDLGAYENPYCALPLTITASGPLTFCNGGSVTLTAGAGNAFLWSTGAATAAITVSTAGSYKVTAANAAGCRGSATRNVVVSQPVITVSGNTGFCPGDSTTLTATGSVSSYTWNNGHVGNTITVNTAGTYTVSGQDSVGCPASKSTIVVQFSTPQPVITNNGGALVTTIFAYYQWLLNGTVIPGATGQTYTPAANGVYTVRVTSSNGCTGTSAAFTVSNVGVGGIEAAGSLQLAPNPARTTVTISHLPAGAVQVVLRDMNGREVYRQQAQGAGDMTIDVSGLVPGLYLAELEADGEIFRGKVEVVR